MISARFAPTNPEIKRLQIKALDRTVPGIDLPHKYTSYLGQFLIDLFVSWVLAQCDSRLCWYNVTACVSIMWSRFVLVSRGSALRFHPLAVCCSADGMEEYIGPSGSGD
jgi:hypothetical protein